MAAAEAGLVDVRTVDWSKNVTPFWGAVIETALSWQGVVGLLRAGLGTIRGALVMPLMWEGLQRKLICFDLITARKP